MPVRNFQGGRFPGVEKINAQLLCEKYLEKMDNCYGCPIRCKRVVKLQEPFAVDPVYGGPEYETLAALGSNCGIDDLEALMKAHELCNRYGIDTISTGVAISFAMECVEKGILGREDTDGLDLTFGNAEAMVRMVERIALRQGLGDLLAEGTKRAAEKIGKGSEEWAMQVKGQELPMHEPRRKQAMGLHYSMHVAGADHSTGIHDTGGPGRGDGRQALRKGIFGAVDQLPGDLQIRPLERGTDAGGGRACHRLAGDGPGADAGRRAGGHPRADIQYPGGILGKGRCAAEAVCETPADGPLKGLDPEKFAEARKDLLPDDGMGRVRRADAFQACGTGDRMGRRLFEPLKALSCAGRLTPFCPASSLPACIHRSLGCGEYPPCQ